MPFKSKRQQRWMYAAEKRGEVPKGTAKRWSEHTKSIKNLPEKVNTTISPSVMGNEELFRKINTH